MVEAVPHVFPTNVENIEVKIKKIVLHMNTESFTLIGQ